MYTHTYEQVCQSLACIGNEIFIRLHSGGGGGGGGGRGRRIQLHPKYTLRRLFCKITAVLLSFISRYVMQGGLQRKRLNRGKLAVAVLLILPELLVWDCSISITLKALGHSFLYVTNPTMRLSATCAALVPVMMAFLVLRGVCGEFSHYRT